MKNIFETKKLKIYKIILKDLKDRKVGNYSLMKLFTLGSTINPGPKPKISGRVEAWQMAHLRSTLSTQPETSTVILTCHCRSIDRHTQAGEQPISKWSNSLNH